MEKNNDIPVFKCDIRITDDGVRANGKLNVAAVYSLTKMGADEKVFDQIKSILGKAMHDAGTLLTKECEAAFKRLMEEKQEGLN